MRIGKLELARGRPQRAGAIHNGRDEVRALGRREDVIELGSELRRRWPTITAGSLRPFLPLQARPLLLVQARGACNGATHAVTTRLVERIRIRLHGLEWRSDRGTIGGGGRGFAKTRPSPKKLTVLGLVALVLMVVAVWRSGSRVAHRPVAWSDYSPPNERCDEW